MYVFIACQTLEHCTEFFNGITQELKTGKEFRSHDANHRINVIHVTRYWRRTCFINILVTA